MATECNCIKEKEMNEAKLADRYDRFVESRSDEVGVMTAYSDGYWDGAHDLFQSLLGELE